MLFALLALLMACSTSPVYATPALPHAFYGHVFVNGSPAPDGTLVSATVDEGTILQNTQNPVPTVGGGFGLTSAYLLVQGDISPGAVITFHVTNADGTAADGTAVYEVGGGPTGCGDLEVTITKPPAGGAPPSGPTYLDVHTDFCGKTGTFPIDKRGKVMKSVVAGCKGGDLTVTINKNTVALDKNGKPLGSLTIVEDTDPPPMPEGKNFIGLPYKLTPSGATFDPALIFTWSYDPEDLPEGVAPEDLGIVVWDGSKWVEVPGVLDTVKNIVTAEVDHFTTFALAAALPKVEPAPPPPVLRPAAWALSALIIEPSAAAPDELVTVTVTVSNTGGRAGTFNVVLMLDGQPELEREISIAAGGSEVVTFMVSREDVGTYTVSVGELTGGFTVEAPAPPPPDEEKEVPIEDIIPTDLTWVWYLIGAGVLVAIILYFLLRRRKKRVY